MLLEEADKKGREKSAMARKRNLAKKMSREYIKPSWFVQSMRYLCEEYGQRMAPIETGKDWGNVRNFLSYCFQQNIPPIEVVGDVIKNWDRVQHAGIKSIHGGKPIHLTRMFNFGLFFKYRVEILDWLYQKKDHSGSYVIKDIDLRGGKK